jgi:hypothetical protein
VTVTYDLSKSAGDNVPYTATFTVDSGPSPQILIRKIKQERSHVGQPGHPGPELDNTALFGSQSLSDRAFRLLRWFANRPNRQAETVAVTRAEHTQAAAIDETARFRADHQNTLEQLTTATNSRITALEDTRDAQRIRAERAEADLDSAHTPRTSDFPNNSSKRPAPGRSRPRPRHPRPRAARLG